MQVPLLKHMLSNKTNTGSIEVQNVGGIFKITLLPEKIP